MVKRFFPIILLIMGGQFGFSQQATVMGTISNVPDSKLFVFRPAYSFSVNDVYMGFQKIELGNKGKFRLSFNLTHPEIMRIVFVDSRDSQLVYYNLYISPGDDLKMAKDGSAPQNNFKVTGKGANNNQPLAIMSNDGVQKFYADTLPDRVITYLGSQNKLHKKVLEEYIKKYKPSTDFITAWEANLQYEMLNDYYSFETNNAYQIDDAYERNYDKWNGVKESLFVEAPLVNEGAMVAATYRQFIQTYLLRTKERLWKKFRTDRSDFLLEWYEKDTAAGAKLFMSDKSNDFQQRIIEKNFTGKVKEYLYAVLINGALGDRDIENLEIVYGRFKMLFPSSTYLELFEDPMKGIALKREHKLTSEMKFIDSAGLFKTWEDIQAYFKGRTVLLDMWGTWCGPCRQDLDRHSAFIKQYFKGRQLDYLYIANSDMGREKLWKELIAFFGLTGYHTMASGELTKDIMTKVKGQGYPTYIIIHKDGTFEQYERGYGIDREVLIAQLEKALSL